MQSMIAATADQEQQNDMSGIDLLTFTQWLHEIQDQPAWRANADREFDYCDGNQLDSEVMRRAQERGLPPAIEPLIGPTIDSVLGHEVMHRADFRVTPDSDKVDGDEVAEAINYRLNQAERNSKADDACSEAYKHQVTVGLGWVEVAREDDPFKYQYRATFVHRNEIYWDWLSKKPDLSDARYLIRRQWLDRKQAALMFPDKADLIAHAGSGWNHTDPAMLSLDGSAMTDLAMSLTSERGWSIEEMEWRDIHNNRVCIFEAWYRVWSRQLVIKSPDGRVVEYDENNDMHLAAVASGKVKVQSAVIGKVRLAWFLGPHKLADIQSPYNHHYFPYVPFWGKREDRTRKPYGLVRGMIYLQDEVNARIARMQWGLAATRTTRTDGAVMDDDDTFRDEVARPDADIILDAEHMRQPGAMFKVERDFELNQQQYNRLIDAREGIKRTGGIYNAFMGQEGQALSGVAQAGLVEQSNKTIADVNDNFKASRAIVGEILVSMIIDDMGREEQEVVIDGQGIREDKVIRLNIPAFDESTGQHYLTNDLMRTKLKVSIDDVPSTRSYRAQQLAAMSEAFKSAPPEYQRVMMPFLFELMDVPRKNDIIRALKDMENGTSPDQVQSMIDQAVDRALKDARIDIEREKIAMQRPLIEAQVKKTQAESVNKGVEAMFGAIQTAQTITAIPQTSVPADLMLRSVGFQDQDAGQIIPSAQPVPGAMPAQEGRPADLAPEQIAAIQRRSPAGARELLSRRQNTNPLTPLNPSSGVNAGIEGGA